MDLASTVCQEMFGNGVKIGYSRMSAFCMAARGTIMRSAVMFPIATGATPTTAATTSAFASPSVQNIRKKNFFALRNKIFGLSRRLRKNVRLKQAPTGRYLHAVCVSARRRTRCNGEIFFLQLAIFFIIFADGNINKII